MELPNYSQQLLRQLYSFCKEQQFCDCNILVGATHFRAHKLVLAAASLLLKPLLESTDTISIDASVVAPDDFALLLEMIYTGRLPLGKHNFTKVISVADNLQMFDVAVSCKALLRDLLSCSNQDHMGRDSSVQTTSASSNSTTISNSSQATVLSAEVAEESQHSVVDSVNPVRIQGQNKHLATAHEEAVGEETMLLNSCSQDSEICSGLSPDGQGSCEGRESTEPPEKRGIIECAGSPGEEKTTAALLQKSKEELIQNVTELGPIQDLLDKAEEGFLPETEKQMILSCCQNTSPKEAVENLIKAVVEEKTLKAESLLKLLSAVKASFPGLHLLLDNWAPAAVRSDGTARWNLESYGKNLLRCHKAALSKFIVDPQLVQQNLPAVQHLAPGSREVMEKIAIDAAGSGVLGALASAALEEESLSAVAVWQVLLVLQDAQLPLKQFLEEVKKEADADLFFQTVSSSVGIVTGIILRHRELISEALHRRAELVGSPPAEVDLAKAMNELLNIDQQEEAPIASWKAALSSALGKSIPANQICQLLCSAQGLFPDLQPVIQELRLAGLLTEGEGDEADVWQQPKEKESQLEAAGQKGKEQKAELSEPPEGVAPKRSFACKTCRKSFHFYCRLQVHEKHCCIASPKDCGETRTSKKELEEGQPETPGSASRKKKKKRLPVACDLCGREFAHASGMQYHKLTEHFDEKPFSCDECGAKFAANSTLKNHQRLHSGDRPFVCKHCCTAFSQASALAYHTKKKHAEGKMYACQYCSAVFAQSIELSRHVRTHTGDKPYVCRECGKGFRQANGLSIHLRNFHNIDDPYDCKKCQMSFPTLQEHHKHIHTAHSREYHPCPTCGKIFSAPSLLERHRVTHVGGKPFSCEICNKAYQQLSGLWYHNRTHHPDIFAAQNHRSSKFSSLQCSSCDKTFLSTAAYRKHTKEEHADVVFHECEQCGGFFPSLSLLQVHTKRQHSGSQLFLCPHCSASFHLQETLQHHVATEHAAQAEQSLACGICRELFTGQEQLEEHCEAEHPKVMFAGSQLPTAHIVQVIQAPEQVITLTESELAGSRVFLTLPDSQGYQGRTELVTVTMEDLLDEKVTLVCEEAK
ncbi:zinc finger and BTB domain-containing protein 40 [Eublepharis macularius]|uniref:Zinc finger and BTB domain-containing protein 40 n=1 Tax=Eublepharis macularius TaxID=481883 RepID=A0AA97LLS7_EUBMA|nr:zinc finger and BTB domain-containing protein 40 [Eublepharis macularius]